MHTQVYTQITCLKRMLDYYIIQIVGCQQGNPQNIRKNFIFLENKVIYKKTHMAVTNHVCLFYYSSVLTVSSTVASASSKSPVSSPVTSDISMFPSPVSSFTLR